MTGDITFAITQTFPGTGTVTSVTGTTPITVDNTNPAAPVVGINAASTTAAGVVQLNDTVASTSVTEAATANAAKTANDAAVAAQGTANTALADAATAQADATQALGDAAAAQATADAALPKAGGTMTGNITFQDAGEGVVFSNGSSIIAISDATGNTNNDVAASSTAVRDAYALADAALPKATYTTKGDLVVGGTAGAPARLPVSASNGLALVANSAASLGVEWVENGIFHNTIYANVGTTTLQAAIDSAPTFGYVVELSPGTFAENVTINRNGSIKINGPLAPIYYSSTNINSITITGSTANFVTLTNLNVSGTLEINGTLGGHALSNVAMQNLVVSGTSSGNLKVEYCNITGSVTIPATYTGLLFFNSCNFQGATITSNAIDPAKVIFTNCVGLPSFVIPNATVVGTNGDSSNNSLLRSSAAVVGALTLGASPVAPSATTLPTVVDITTGAVNPVVGASGTFTSQDGKTITVANGLITNII
jgi:hypothetical protein